MESFASYITALGNVNDLYVIATVAYQHLNELHYSTVHSTAVYDGSVLDILHDVLLLMLAPTASV